MNKELEEYLLAIAGESVSAKNSKVNKSQQIREFLQAVKTVSYTAEKSGVEKYCTFYNGLAILKSKAVVKKADLTSVESYGMAELSKWLIKNGVNTPRLYSVFYADKHYVEVFDKAQGEQVYLSSADTVLKGAFGPDYDCDGFSNYTDEERKILCDYIYNFNKKSQLKLMALPDSSFDKYVKDIMFLVDAGFVNIDVNSGNVLIADKNFNIIDIDYRKTLEIFTIRLEVLLGRKCTVEDVVKKLETNPRAFNLLLYNDQRTYTNELAESALFPFCSSRWFVNHLTEEQQKDLLVGDRVIVKRVVDALARQGVLFNTTKGKCFSLLKDTFNEDPSLMAEVMQSQIEQQKSKI